MRRFEHIRHKPPTALQQPRQLVLVLAPLRSNVNLSRIVRHCGCAGITTIYQCGPGKIDREIARDAIDEVEVIVKRSIVPVIRDLRSNGYVAVGLEQTTSAVCLYEFPFNVRTALVVGGERDGLDQDVLDQLDGVVEIPVYGRPFSYNVATAASMALYEYCRQYPLG